MFWDWRPSLGRAAAADGDHLARDIAAFIRAEEAADRGDLLVPAHPAERDAGDRGGAAFAVEILAVGGDRAGRDRVDGDPPGSELARQRLGQPPESLFGSRAKRTLR